MWPALIKRLQSGFIIPYSHYKQQRNETKEENKGFAVFHKNAVPTARSGYLFSCLISCLHGYKIGHKKQINKVLFRASIYLIYLSFGTAGTK